MDEQHAIKAHDPDGPAMSALQQEVERLRLQLRVLQRDIQTDDQAHAGLAREVQRLEGETRRAELLHLESQKRWLTDQEERQADEMRHLRVKVQELEAEKRRADAEAKALWDERHLKLEEHTRRLQRELEVAQAVAKLAPVRHPVAAPASSPSLEEGQQTMIRLLRDLVTLIRGEEPRPTGTAAQSSPEEGTQVSFPPEPLWPDAFRQSQWTTEDYARELGQEESRP